MLGGAQDALDDANHPYLPHEAALARAFGEADKAVLGICLGAQILARALRRREHPRPAAGVRLARGSHRRMPAAPIRCFQVRRAAAPIFHWHLDTFTLPPGAVHLATSDMTQMQAFRIGRASYGIQFHFEAGTELVESWTSDFAEEIAEYAPDWPERQPLEAAKHGAAADAAGLALARAWIERIALPSPSRRGPARKTPMATASE